MKYNNPTINIGDILTRPKALGFIEHFGVAVARNMVLQNTPEKGEHLTTYDGFSAGKPVTVHKTGANPMSVQARSQQILANPKKYDAIRRNCQHTVYEVICGIAKSPLVVAALVVAGVIFVGYLLTRR